MQKAHSFVDAIVYLCLGPRENASLDNSIRFTCPHIDYHKIRPVTVVTEPIIEISDGEDEEDELMGPLVVIPDPPTLMDPAPTNHGVGVPSWVLNILDERKLGKSPASFLLSPLT